MKSVGAQLRVARQTAALAMREIAAVASCSTSYISDIEHGRRAPPTWVIEAYSSVTALDADRVICEAHGVPTDIREALRDPAFVKRVRALMEAA